MNSQFETSATARESTAAPAPQRGRMRFDADLDAAYRASLRIYMRWPRTILFFVFACGFALLLPLLQARWLVLNESVLPLLTLVELAVAAPVCLAAAAASFYRHTPRPLAQGVQSAAVVVTHTVMLLFLELALDQAIRYPVGFFGVVVGAQAFFSGFSWVRVALTAAVSGLVASALGFLHDPPAAAAAKDAFRYGLISLVSMFGSYYQDFLARRRWWDAHRLRLARDELQALSDRFRAFMEYTPAMVWIKNAAGDYLSRNKAFVSRFGEGTLNSSVLFKPAHFDAVDLARQREADRLILDYGQPQQMETGLTEADGRRSRWWVQKFPIQDGSGQRLIAGIGLDITRRWRLEQELQRSQTRFHAFLDHFPGVCWLKDEQGRYLYLNEAGRRFHGFDDDRWAGRRHADLHQPEFARLLDDLEARARQRDLVQVDLTWVTNACGERRYWRTDIFPIRGAEGEKYIGGVATDITPTPPASREGSPA